jgi:VWFA-related protein
MRSAFLLRLGVPLALSLVFASLGAFRTPVAAQARERTLFVSAVDRDGNPVEQLPPSAFIVREDGVRREVLTVSSAIEPVDIALLVDNSAAASEVITFLRQALTNFVATMTPDNRVALITLADRPTIAVDYTNDTKRLSDGVGRIFSMSQSGMTLLDAIVESARGLSRRDTPRAVMVPVITDGTEFTNRYSRDLVRTLVRDRIALHIVTIGTFYHSEEHALRERSFLLDTGPRESGGQRIQLLSAHALDQSLQRLARELLSQYKVVYARPQTLIPPDRVEVSSARDDVTMRGTLARGEQ